MRQHDLRARIAYVQQRAWLFSGDVESNLLYRDAGAGEQDLDNALSIAQAGAFIDQTEPTSCFVILLFLDNHVLRFRIPCIRFRLSAFGCARLRCDDRALPRCARPCASTCTTARCSSSPSV